MAAFMTSIEEKAAEHASLGRLEGEVTFLEPALWRQLSEAASDEEFFFAWLNLQCLIIGNVQEGCIVLGPPDSGPFTPVALWPGRACNPQPFGPVIERALQERRGVMLRAADAAIAGETEQVILAYPVAAVGKIHGAVALKLKNRKEPGVKQAMRQLQWGVNWLENRLLTQSAGRSEQIRRRQAEVLDLAGLCVQEKKFQATAMAFVTELASLFGCDRVSIGFVQGRKVKIRAISHNAQFLHKMNLVRAIAAAMDEAVDQKEVLRIPEHLDSSHFILHAHHRLAADQGDNCICTFPFLDSAGKGYGALTLERGGPSVFDDETLELLDAVVALLAPMLEIYRQNDLKLPARMRQDLLKKVTGLFGSEHLAFKLLALLFLGAAAFFSFATGEYRVTAASTLEGIVQQSLVAPFAGYIAEAPARAGDILRKGKLMANLDEKDLRLDYLNWTSQKNQHVFEYRQAMAKNDTALAKILQAQIGQADAKLALLEEQLSRTAIVAPFDGIVISGDLSQTLGAPVERGQVLFQIAPLDSYRVMMHVEETDIREIRNGQTGKLILTAMPGITFPFRVDKVTPVTVTKDGKSVFKVEGRLEKISEQLRPGMEGFGKIEAGRQKLIWIWTHKLIDWIRLKAWSWLP